MDGYRYMAVYCDTTGLYTEDEMDFDNICYIQFPEQIIHDWFLQSEDSMIYSYEGWLCNYDCDGTDGLYSFALDRGFVGRREDYGKEADKKELYT